MQSCLQIRLISVGAELKEVATDAVDIDSGSQVDGLAWSYRGQILAATTAAGSIHCFLGAIPTVSAANSGSVVHMESLAECSVMNCVDPSAARLSVPLRATPHCLALSSAHVVASVNNMVDFYSLDAPLEPPRTRTFAGGAVEAMVASETHLALLIDGRVVVHAVEHPTELITPYQEQDVSAFTLTESFLILATAKGQLQHYSVGEGNAEPLNEYRHSREDVATAIDALWAPHDAVRMLFQDASGGLFLFSPVNDHVRLHFLLYDPPKPAAPKRCIRHLDAR